MTGGSIVDPFVHEVLYYRDEGEFVAGVVPFLRAGIAAGEPCLVVVPRPRLRLVEPELGTDGVSFVDMLEVGRNPNRILSEVMLTFVDGHRPRRVRIVSEPLYAGRSTEAVAAGVRHESLVNLALAGTDVTVRCPVDIGALAHLVPYAERTHRAVLTPGGRRPSHGYTDPQTMVALLNQPLPQPRRPVESHLVDAAGGDTVAALLAEHAAGLDARRSADLLRAAAGILAVSTGAATVRVWTVADRVVCEIRAAGDIADFMAGRVVPDPDSPRGRALRAADLLCDLVQTHTTAGATVTRLHAVLSGVRRR